MIELVADRFICLQESEVPTPLNSSAASTGGNGEWQEVVTLLEGKCHAGLEASMSTATFIEKVRFRN